jgi:hypothetical protein
VASTEYRLDESFPYESFDPTFPIVITNSGFVYYRITDVAGNTLEDSVEVTIAQLKLTVTLDTSETSVEVGAVTAPLNSIVAGVQQASASGTSVSSTPFSAVPFSAVTVSDAPFSAVTVDNVPFSAVPFSAVPFSAVNNPWGSSSDVPTLAALPFSAVPFSAVNLSDAPFSAVGLDSVLLSELSTPDGQSMEHYLQGTPLSGTPLLSLNFDDLVSVPFSAVQIADSPFSAVPFSAVPFSAVPFSAVPFSAVGDFVDCDQLDTSPETGKPCEEYTIGEAIDALKLDGTGNSLLTIGDVLGMDDVNISSTVLAELPFSAVALGQISIGGIPFSAVAPEDTVNEWCNLIGPETCNTLGIQLDVNASGADDDNGASLVTLALFGVDMNVVPFSAVDIDNLPFSAVGLGLLPFSAVNWTSTPIGQTPFSAVDTGSAPFSAVGVASIDDIVDCTAFDTTEGTGKPCEEYTFADAFLAGAFQESFLGSASLAVLDGVDLSGYTLADLLFGLLPPTDLPWVEIDDLNSIRLPIADGTRSSFEYVVTLDVTGRDADLVQSSITLPIGFVPTGAQAMLFVGSDTVGLPTGWTESTPGGGSNPAIVVTFDDLTNAAIGTYTIRIPVWAGVVLGSFEATAEGFASRNGTETSQDSSPASITVFEAAEPSGGASLAFVEASGGCILESDLEVSHISTGGDVDVYRFQVPPGCTGGRIEAKLTNLAVDLDLTLLGEPLPYLRGEPVTGYGYVEDHKYDLNPDDDALDADILRDIPINPADIGLSSELLVPIAVSANRGTNDEQIEARTPKLNSDYYLVVSGFNGARSDFGFALQAQFDGNAAGSCGLAPIPWSASITAGNIAPVNTDPGLNTLFLHNAGWLEGLADPNSAALLTALGEVGTSAWRDLGVNAIALAVDSDPTVASALAFWYSNRCNIDAANAVVSAIGSLIDTYTAERDIDYITIVGDDAQIPFARLVDNVTYSNETDHASAISQQSETKVTLSAGYYFSDDPLGSDHGIAIADTEFFVPVRAVGRMLESPGDILGQMNAFLARGGVLDPTSGDGTLAGAVGYDFLSDGVDLIVSNMKADAFDFGAGDSRVLNELNVGGNLWTSVDLQNLLATPDLAAASINAHADQYRFLPADGNSTGDESDVFSVGDTSIANALIFSVGCHSGLSISNAQLAGALPVWAVDWAESFSGLGDLWIGNSGFGYGDTAVVAYSESIAAAFGDFVGTHPTGLASMLAKQEFASNLFVVSPYQTKAMNEWIFYGLPMTRTSPDVPLDPVVPDPGFGPGTLTDPYGSGLTIAPVALASTGLQLVTTPSGSYYVGNGGTFETRGRAITALGEIDVTIPGEGGGLGRVAGGAIITGLTSEEDPAFPALIFNPVVDLGDGENPALSTSDRFPVPEAVFPAGLSQIVDYVDQYGQARQNLLLAATRFQPQGSGTTGVLEKFRSFEGTVYYRNPGSTDFTAPLIKTAQGVSDGTIAFFEITVEGEPRTGATDDVLRVNVLFGPQNPVGLVSWKSIDLVRVPGTQTWVGGAPVDYTNWLEGYAFWVQTCDYDANCDASTAKGVYFSTTDTGGSDAVTIDIYDSGTQNSATAINGWFNSAVDARIGTTAAEIVSYTLDSQPTAVGAAEVTVPITEDGGHFLLAIDSDGNTGTKLLAIDSVGPVVDADIQGAYEGQYYSPNAQIVLSAVDPFGSGVDYIEYSWDGEPFTRVEAATETIPAQAGTLTFRAVDRAENVSEDQTEILDGIPVHVCLRYDPDAPQPITGTVNIKLELCDADGNNISKKSIVLTAVTVDSMLSPGPNFSGNSNEGFEFRFTGGGYSYNLDLVLPDGTVLGDGLHTLEFVTSITGTYVFSAAFTLKN